jgi:predicted HicB family RNase H-like nuclease
MPDIRVALTADLHAALKAKAALAQMSLIDYLTSLITKAVVKP